LVSSEYGQALTDNTLLDLARMLSLLDRQLLFLLRTVYEKALPGFDNAKQVEHGQYLAEIRGITSQFQQIERGDFSFSELYLKDRHILQGWQKAFNMISDMLESGEVEGLYNEAMDYMREIVLSAVNVEKALITAGSKGILSSEALTALGDRWLILQKACNVCHSYDKSFCMVTAW
jgi:hypothetical protein